MILRCQKENMPFEVVSCDDFYGRHDWFRAAMHSANLCYMGEIPFNTRVSLLVPANKKYPTKQANEIGNQPETGWTSFRVRASERGFLEDKFAFVLVYTWRDGKSTSEWLAIRLFSDGLRFTLSATLRQIPLGNVLPKGNAFGRISNAQTKTLSRNWVGRICALRSIFPGNITRR